MIIRNVSRFPGSEFEDSFKESNQRVELSEDSLPFTYLIVKPIAIHINSPDFIWVQGIEITSIFVDQKTSHVPFSLFAIMNQNE